MVSEFDGLQCSAQLFEDRVVIYRKSFTGRIKSEKVIPLEQINDVEFRRTGALSNGYIQFTTAGMYHSPFVGINDNAVPFSGSRYANDEAEKFVIQVREVISEKSNDEPQATAPPSKSQELINLKQLLDDGAISQDEFDKLKQEIISK